MPMDVTVSAVVDRPRAEVAAFCADPDNDTTWYVNIKEVEWLTDRPVRVGTRVARVAHFLGRRLAYTYVVEELVPGERVAMRAEDGPFPMRTTYTFADVDGGTEVSITNAGGPGGFFGLATPLLARQVRAALEADLAKLKAVLEARR